MLYYIIPIISCFILGLFSLNKYEKYKPIIFNIIVVYSIFIFCCGYMTGSDWKNYELMYNDIEWDNLFSLKKEWFFYFFMALFKMLGFGFFPFLIFCKVLVFIISVNFLKNNTIQPYIPFAIFLSYNVLFLFVDNPLRFMIAIGIVFFSYKYLFDRKFCPFLLIILLSSLFHISALVMIPVYFLSNYSINRVVLLIIYILGALFLSPDVMFVVIEKLFPTLPIMMGSYYDKILISDYQTFALGKIVFFSFFCLILYYKDLVINYSKNGKYIYTLSVLSLLIGIVVSAIPTFFRIAIYISIFVIISLSIIITSKRNFLLTAYLVCYFLLSVISTSLTSYVYTPYTNYFFYISKNLPYSYRSDYNKIEYYKRYNTYPE